MRKLILLSLCLVLYLGAKATDIRIQATTAGNLKTVASAYLNTVTNLTVTGTIDARDFKTMRDNMPLLQSLDISAVNVTAYNGAGGTSDFGGDYPANTLPEGAFVSSGMGGASTAISIILPNSITSLGMGGGGGIFPYALTSLTIGNGITSIDQITLSGLSNLTDLTLGNGMTNLFDMNIFQSLTNLKALNITSENPNYSSVEGVLMNKEQSSLLYCPGAKTGNVTIPATITSIPDLFFSNRTGITSFTLKHSIPTNLTLGTTVFDGIDKSKCTLYVPTTKLSAYSAISEWSGFTHKYQGNGLWVETITSTLAKEANSTKIANVNSNVAWTASSDQTWLTLSSGMTGFGTITATATANSTLSARQATITITASGLTSQTVVVTQAAGVATLTVDAAAVSIAKSASSTTAVNVTSNTIWTASSDQAWLTVPTGYTGNHSLTFTAVSANTAITTRQAIVTLKATGVTDKKITITQAAGDTTLTVSAATYALGKGANEQGSIQVTSNTNWIATSDQEWCVLKDELIVTGSGQPVLGMGNAVLTFYTEYANPLTTTRTATITLTASGAATKTITVTQAAGDIVPLLTSSTSLLSNLNYTYGSGPSTVKSFTVAGSSLSGDIIVKPSSRIEISKSSTSGFGSTALTVTQSGGKVDSARIYVRFKAGLVVGTYTDTVYVSSIGAVSKTINARGTILSAPTPQLTTSTTWLDGMNYNYGSGPSAVKSFTVAGSSLTGSIIITPSSNYEISKNSASGFGTTALTITQTTGRVDSARIYVRLKAGLIPGVYSDTLSVSSTGATTKQIYSISNVMQVTVIEEDPHLSCSTYSLNGMNYTYGSGPSAVQSFTVGGSTLTSDILVKPSSRIEISKSSTIGFGSTALTVTQSGGRVDSARIYVRLKAGLVAGAYTDTVYVSSTGAISSTIIVRGTVTSTITTGDEPFVTSSTSLLSGFNYTYGSGPSAVQSFTVGGGFLFGNITVVPSYLFEISRSSQSGFGTSSISISPIGGRVDSARIYVRLKAGLTTGTFADSLLILSNGATKKGVYFTGTVTANIIYGCTDSKALNYDSLATVNNGSCQYKNDSTQIVYGCTDSLALNYNYLATVNNGSCQYKNDSTQTIYGCMKPSAKNYNALATIDDGSCKYDTIIVISGCTKKFALNYNPSATIDDGTCEYDTTKVIAGCTDKKAINYNASAVVNDGTCKYELATLVYGCTDPIAMNYNPYAIINNDNCIYKKLIPGCTDSLALNYNATASVNDGSCKYVTKIWGCMNPLAQNYDSKANHDNGECTYVKTIKGCTDAAALNYNPEANQENGSCIFNQNVALGCIDVHALNYNPFANKDNGSCVYITISDTIKGCTDATALNYNPIAMKSDNSQCVYTVNTSNPVSGCMSPMALNYNDKAVVDNGSCVFAKPMNLVTIVIPEATVVADTLAKVQEGFCSFNYSIPIDTVYIINTKIINETQMEVTWGIRQGSLETTVKQVYNIGKDGNTLLYLSLVCKSGTPNSGTRKFAKESGDGSLKAVTISSVLKKDDGTTGVSLIQLSNGFKVYPVPVRNEMHIAFDAKENERIQYNVFSVEGMRVSTGQMSFENGKNQSIINTCMWSPGMYLIQLYRDGRLIDTQKFVKE